MAKYGIWLAIIAVVSPLPPAFAQTATGQGANTQSEHSIVPLTPLSLDGRVSGDPDKPGALFVIRIPNDANFVVLPHWHPEDENVVVVKGTWYVGMGDRFDRNALREMNVGDYILIPKKMHHFAWSKTETIIQVHGIGPFKIIPVDTWEFLGGGKLTSNHHTVEDSQNASLFRFKVGTRVKSQRGEGVVVEGVHSKENNRTQYDIQTENGQRFYESEEDLTAVPADRNLQAGPISGIWNGVMHGMTGGDTSCTFYIQRGKDQITGVLALPQGGVAFNNSTFRNNTLELHLDTLVAGKFAFNAEYKQGELHGNWSLDSGPKGAWEAKKSAAPTAAR